MNARIALMYEVINLNNFNYFWSTKEFFKLYSRNFIKNLIKRKNYEL